ncbi:MAG TPA: T9SS type A sorting domain-containing protein [Chitinophagaceae bacterium]|nr:T9SS type A sorting domain-containing protein [Chitinophagaceae bacterium]
MPNNLYSENHPYPNLKLSWVKTIYCLFAAFFLVAATSFGQGACPNSNCTSGDMTITKVELVDATTLGPLPNTCIPGQQNVSVKLKVTFNATSKTRYGFLIIGDLVIDGQAAGKVWQCYGEDFTQGDHTRILDQIISWPCGSTLSLVNVYTAWDNQAPSTTVCSFLNSDGTINNCGAIDPKCRYYANQAFTVAAPLVANFTYSGSCPGNTLYQPITFNSPSSGVGTSTGGNKPYQYSWVIKDATDNSTLATSTSNPYTYTPTTNHDLSVTLTVTDASSPQGSDAETKTVTVISCCTPPTVSSNPANQTKCEGSSAAFSVGYSGGSPAPSIQWQVSTNNGGSWSNLINSGPYSNVTTTTLNISAVTIAMNGYQYHAILQSGVCESVTSNAAILTVNPTSVGGSVTSAQTICYGSQPANDLSLSGNTGAVIKWQRSTDNFVSNVSDISNISSTLTAATIGVLTQDTWFRAVVKSGECSSANSGAIKITVNPTSVGGSVASNQTICYGNQPNSNLTLSGNTGAVVKWQRSTDNFVSNVSDIANTTATLTAAAIGALTQDTWFRAVVKSGVCSEANSGIVKITVNPTSVGGSVAAAQTICSGNQPNSSVSLSGNTGTVVKWQKSTSSNFSSGVSDIASTSTTLSAAAIGVLTQDTWIRAIVKSGVCSETNSDAVKITVQQPISSNTIAASQTICSGTAPSGLTGSTPNGGDGSYTYQWQSKTTGGFSNIVSATGKDYSPGVLTQTTEFKRIVTAGSACSNNTSASIMITISPESAVYAIAGSNFCLSAPNTGTITLMGSYPGVSYQLKKASDNSDVQLPQTGTGSSLTWSNLEAGSYYVYGTGIAPTYCTSRTANATVHEFDCSYFYTLTQGYYGGKNGKSCLGSNPVNTIKYLLGSVDLVTGSTNSVTAPATDEGANKLNQTLPGGNCDITTGCFTYPVYLTKQGKINNVLLSQTITLGLNTRWEGGKLLLFHIESGWLTTQKMKGCGADAVLVTDCSDGGTVSSIKMNQHVVDYLGSSATVNDLLKLANDILGGTLTPGINSVPSYSDVNDAVDAINQSFDEGRRFLDYFSVKQTCEILFPAPIILLADPTITVAAKPSVSVSSVTVTAYPNPYTDNVSFVIESKQTGQGSLEVYNMSGQKVKTIFQGHISVGTQRFSLNLPAQQRSNLFYLFRVGDQKVAGKLLHIYNH